MPGAVTIFDCSTDSQGQPPCSGSHHTDCFTLQDCNAFDSFTCPSGPALTLDVVKVVIITPGFSATVTFDLDLYADGSGAPGSHIAKLVAGQSSAQVANTQKLVTCTLSVTPNLTPGTRYWIQITDPSNSGVAVLPGPYNSGDTGVPGESSGSGGGSCGSNAIVTNGTAGYGPQVQFFLAGDPPVATNPVLMKFAGQNAGGFPVIAGDARGIVMLIHGVNKSTGHDIYQMATTPDVVNYAGWTITKLWDFDLDLGPPPPNLKIATGASGQFLSQDITDAARGRAFMSITAADTSVAGSQALYVGLIEWDAVTPV